jgi:hypothetical protein
MGPSIRTIQCTIYSTGIQMSHTYHLPVLIAFSFKLEHLNSDVHSAESLSYSVQCAGCSECTKAGFY